MFIGVSWMIPGQETGNIAYVRDNGVGVYNENPGQIARIVADWLAPDNPMLPAMRKKARELARPRAALEIAAALSDLLS